MIILPPGHLIDVFPNYVRFMNEKNEEVVLYYTFINSDSTFYPAIWWYITLNDGKNLTIKTTLLDK